MARSPHKNSPIFLAFTPCVDIPLQSRDTTALRSLLCLAFVADIAANRANSAKSFPPVLVRANSFPFPSAPLPSTSAAVSERADSRAPWDGSGGLAWATESRQTRVLEIDYRSGCRQQSGVGLRMALTRLLALALRDCGKLNRLTVLRCPNLLSAPDIGGSVPNLVAELPRSTLRTVRLHVQRFFNQQQQQQQDQANSLSPGSRVATRFSA